MTCRVFTQYFKNIFLRLKDFSTLTGICMYEYFAHFFIARKKIIKKSRTFSIYSLFLEINLFIHFFRGKNLLIALSNSIFNYLFLLYICIDNTGFLYLSVSRPPLHSLSTF